MIGVVEAIKKSGRRPGGIREGHFPGLQFLSNNKYRYKEIKNHVWSLLMVMLKGTIFRH